jgi:cellobiose-specific phosphotransferase system component IIC
MIVIYRVKILFSITNGRKNMKEIITMVKGYVDDLAHLMMSFVAIGAVSEVIFGTGVFGVNVIGNLTSIINTFGESGFAGLVALLVLVGLFRK